MSRPSNEANQEILETVGRYYSEKLRAYGATAQGVDWNSEQSQSLRFDQLLRLVADEDEVSLVDYGCGYGALLDHLTKSGKHVAYCGFDISDAMIGAARTRHSGVADSTFTSDLQRVPRADYAIASGVFNVRLGYSENEWRGHIDRMLDSLNALSRRGFSFNMLSTHSDPGLRRPDLHYTDPLDMFHVCRRFSAKLALLHDYPLFEFTMIVRK